MQDDNTQPAMSPLNQPTDSTPSEPQPSDQAPTTPTMTSVPADVPPAPSQPAVSVGQSAQGKNFMGKNLLKKPAAVAALGVVAAVAIGGGLVFGLYLPNTPSGIYGTSLSNTARGIDMLLDYGKTQDKAGYKGTTYDGSLSVKSPSGSFDATLTGDSDTSGNADLAFAANIMGQKGSAQLRTIHVDGTDSPDLYFQVSGIKPLLASSGMDALDSLDGQWISVDHTLIDTYAAQLKTSDTTPRGQQPSTELPSYAQLDDAARRVQTVNKDYLFSTNGSKAVLKEQKFVGTETVDGRSMNHYVIGYDKTHFEAYIDALKAALDSSKLNDWAKKSSGDNLSKMMDLESMKSGIKDAKSDATFDLWTDNSLKVVSKVSFKDPTNGAMTLTLSQSHVSGDEYPFALAYTGKDESGASQDGTWSVTINTKTHKLTFNVKAASESTEGTTTFAATIHATPSNNAVKVSVPAGAKSVNDILSSLGLGGLGGDAAPAGGMTTNPFGSLDSGTQI